MNKIVYYLRIIFFIIYLVLLFLMIDKLFSLNILSVIFFIANIIYSFIIILTILSKKKVFNDLISYNLLNIGIYIYIGIIYYITFISTKLDILSNINYFNNNFILILLLIIGLLLYTFMLNKEEK